MKERPRHTGWLQGYQAAQVAREEELFPRPAGTAAPLAEVPFTLRAEVATTPSAKRLQRPLQFEDTTKQLRAGD